MPGEEIDLAALEALIFASEGPATAASIRRAFADLAPGSISPAVAEINARLAASGRPYEIAEVAGGNARAERLEELKRRIALGAYKPDAESIAADMLARVGLDSEDD